MDSTPKTSRAAAGLLRYLLERGPTLRSVMARRLGLSMSVLGVVARPLVRRGLLAYSAGNPRIGLRAGYGYVIGIDMGASHLHFALADFGGEIHAEVTEPVRPEDGPRKVVSQIKKGISELIGSNPNHGRVQALAIGVPSVVHPVTSLVAFANNLPGWKNINLLAELGRACRVPVVLENDANMAALGERWRGVARGIETFVFIALGTGIGAGLFIDGKLHRGRLGAAGELYTMNVEWPRWVESFPETGYFESYVSGMGIASEGRKALGVTAPGAADLRSERDAHFVFEAFRRGNPKARAVLQKTFTMLGVGLADVSTVLDPDLFVLGGGITKGAPQFMLATVERVLGRIQPDPPRVCLSALGDKAQTYGAIYSALAAALERAAT